MLLDVFGFVGDHPDEGVELKDGHTQVDDVHWIPKETLQSWHKVWGRMERPKKCIVEQLLSRERVDLSWQTLDHLLQVGRLLLSELVLQVWGVCDEPGLLWRAAEIVFVHRDGQRFGQEPKGNGRYERDDTGDEVTQPPRPHPAGVVRGDSQSFCAEIWPVRPAVFTFNFYLDIGPRKRYNPLMSQVFLTHVHMFKVNINLGTEGPQQVAKDWTNDWNGLDTSWHRT